MSTDPSAIELSFPENAGERVEEIGQAVFLKNDMDKPSYSYSFKLNGKLRVSTPLSNGAIDEARSRAVSLLASRTDKLSDVTSLLIESHHVSVTDLRAFISAWTALEIFVNSTFASIYRRVWFEMLVSVAPKGGQKYLGRVQELMSKAERLADKFSVIASILDSSNSEADSKTFDRCKNIRDALFHADAPALSYPTFDVQKLVRKYLNLHLKTQLKSI